MDARVTQLPIQIIDVGSRPARVTQLPIQIIDVGSRPARVTQLPIQVITLPVVPARVTQLPIQTVETPRPVPEPVTVLPIAPITEEIEFLTSVNITQASSEQRSRLRAVPRQRYSHNLHLTDDKDWRTAFVEMYKNQGREYPYPLYHYWTPLIADAEAEDDELFFDPSHTDLRDGELLAVFDVFTREVTLHEIDIVTATGALLVSPVGRNLTTAHRVCPALLCRMTDVPSLVKYERLGDARVTLETTRPRVFRRETNTTLATLQGIPVLEDQPFGQVEEMMNRGAQWLDSGTSIPLAWNKWRYGGRISGGRQYFFDRWDRMDYWRALLDYMGGRQRVIYVPSFYDDVPLAEVPELGATEIVTTEIQLYEMIQSRMLGALTIFRENGIIHRAIVSATMNYDDNGDPSTVTLKLNQSIGSSAGSNVIDKISLLYKMRSTTDVFRMQHFLNETVISLNLESVYQ